MTDEWSEDDSQWTCPDCGGVLSHADDDELQGGFWWCPRCDEIYNPYEDNYGYG